MSVADGNYAEKYMVHHKVDSCLPGSKLSLFALLDGTSY